MSMSAMDFPASSLTSRDEVIFNWTIDDILTKPNNEIIQGPYFAIPGFTFYWQLVFRRELSVVNKESISVALWNYKEGQPQKVDFSIELALVDGNDMIKWRSAGFYLGKVFGWMSLISLEQLRDPSNGLLVDGKHLKFVLILPKKQLPEAFKWQPFDVEQLEHCDVRVLVGGCTFGAHKFMLANRSPFFAGMFNNEFREQQQGEVRLHDIEADVFREVLRFIYNGQIEGYEKIADKLIVAADFLQMDGLKKVCADLLSKKLSVHNCLDVLKVAHETRVGDLKQASFRFINQNCLHLNDAVIQTFFSQHSDMALELWQYSCGGSEKQTLNKKC